MVATCQKNSQGKNKILHYQQKNQEIVFVSQRKLTFWRNVRENWKKNPSDLEGLCNGGVDHIINIAIYKSMELNISWEISNKWQNPCFTSNKKCVKDFFKCHRQQKHSWTQFLSPKTSFVCFYIHKWPKERPLLVLI